MKPVPPMLVLTSRADPSFSPWGFRPRHQMAVRASPSPTARAVWPRPATRADIDLDHVPDESHLLVDKPLDLVNTIEHSLHLHCLRPPAIGPVFKTNLPEPRVVHHTLRFVPNGTYRVSSKCLVKRRRAVRGRNPARDSQADGAPKAPAPLPIPRGASFCTDGTPEPRLTKPRGLGRSSSSYSSTHRFCRRASFTHLLTEPRPPQWVHGRTKMARPRAFAVFAS